MAGLVPHQAPLLLPAPPLFLLCFPSLSSTPGASSSRTPDPAELTLSWWGHSRCGVRALTPDTGPAGGSGHVSVSGFVPLAALPPAARLPRPVAPRADTSPSEWPACRSFETSNSKASSRNAHCFLPPIAQSPKNEKIRWPHHMRRPGGQASGNRGHPRGCRRDPDSGLRNHRCPGLSAASPAEPNNRMILPSCS